MKIGIDLDEVIVDFVKGFSKFYNLKFNKNLLFEDWHSYNFWEVVGISREQSIELVNEFNCSAMFDNLELIKNAEKTIKEILKNHKVFIITARSVRFKEKTYRFIKNLFPINTPEIIHSGDFHNSQGKTKSEICKALEIDFLIEDHKGYAFESAQEGVRVFLFDKPWNKNLDEHEKIIRVSGWKEVLDKLEEFNILK